MVAVVGADDLNLIDLERAGAGLGGERGQADQRRREDGRGTDGAMTEKHGMSFAKKDTRWRKQAQCRGAGSRLREFYAQGPLELVKRRTER